MKLWVTGLNHRTAPVEVRERLAFKEQDLAGALDQLKQWPGLQEGLILSTCNRVEVAVTAEDTADPQNCIEEFLTTSQKIVDRAWIRPYVYGFGGTDAIRHLFRVAASLDSMVIGEPQILGQLKEAYSVAKERGALSGFLETVLTRAFNVAKRVRTETEIGASAVSISYAAVELAREIFGSLKNRKVMLIGAGKMSELAARHLSRSGVSQILVTNRTRSRAEEVAEMVSGTIIEYDRMYATLPEVDIVITSSGAPDYILRKDQAKRIIEARKNRPIFIIDIAVPRNVEPAVNEIDNIFLYDIDDLQRVVENNLRGRLDEAQEADRIVAEEVERLEGLAALAPGRAPHRQHAGSIRADASRRSGEDARQTRLADAAATGSRGRAHPGDHQQNCARSNRGVAQECRQLGWHGYRGSHPARIPVGRLNQPC